MEKHVLSNGLNVIVERRSGETVAVEVSVKAGSVNEGRKVSGASHFLEHMLFEGTKRRKSAREITNTVEKLGGILTAGTDTERTVYVCKVLRKDLDVALDVLSDMLVNPLFDEGAFERQRKVILSEISLDRDNPHEHLWTLLQGSLFPQHPFGRPSYGSEESVSGISREDVVGYYERFYRASNMTVAVVGDVSDALSHVRKYFKELSSGKTSSCECAGLKPVRKRPTVEEREGLLQSYGGVGFRAFPRARRESYSFDLIDAVLGRGQSGRIFDEVRNKRGLAYDAGVEYESSRSYGVFCAYACTDACNEDEAERVIWEELEKVGELSEGELEEAKAFTVGRYVMRNDEPLNWADTLCFCAEVADVGYATDYPRKIGSTNISEVESTARRYLREGKSCRVVIRGKK